LDHCEVNFILNLETPSKSFSLLTRILGGWVSFVQRFKILTILVCVLSAAFSFGYATMNLGFKTARTDLVHPAEESAQSWKRYADEFGGESDIILVVGGREEAAMISALETIAHEIASHPKHFEKLCFRLQVDKLRSKGLYQAPLADLKAIKSRLAGLEPLLIAGFDQLNLELMTGATLQRLTDRDETVPIDPSSKTTLLQTATLLESLRTYLSPGSVYQSPWADPMIEGTNQRIRKIPQYFFSEDGRFAFLRVIPVVSEGTFVRNQEPIRILRDILSRIRPLYSDLEFGLTGLPVLETDEMEAAQRGSEYSTILSAVGVLFIFMVGFRALRHPLFAMVSLGVAACWTLGFVTLTIGHLNILSVSFIVTLIGLGIDYGIVWISQFESFRVLGMDVNDANTQTSRAIGAGTVVGAITTAAAFFTTMMTGFVGLRELGWIAGGGILFCLLSMYTVLPALLSWGAAPLPKRQRIDKSDRATFFPVSRWPRFFVGAATIIAVAAGVGIYRLHFDYNLLHLQPSGLASVQWEHRLMAQTGTSGWYALSMANSAEEARRLAEEFRQLPSVGRVVEIASFIPPDQPEKMPIIQEIHDLVAATPPTGDLAAMRSSPAGLSRVLGEMAQLVPAGSGSDQIVLQRLITAARQAEKVLKTLPPAEQLKRLTQYEHLWIEDLSRSLNRLRDVSDPTPVTVRDLPDSLVSRFYSSTGKWAVQIFAKGSVWDMEPLVEFQKELSTIDPQVTGKPIATLHSLRQMTDGFRVSGLLALVIILGAVWLDFRNFGHTVLAMLPLLVGIGMMFGLLGWLGIDLNPANMIALPLILGIGVDYGVHVIHDYRDTAGPYVLRWRLGKALILNALTTILSFASLALAPHWGMVSMGIALGIGVSTATLSAIFLLPALLAIISRNKERADFSAETSTLELASTVYFKHAA
jgi:hopanoid biosynthesis associated RND transporter like protein HpnN